MGEYTNKDPEDWKTGNEPMTEKQRKYLEGISKKEGIKFDFNSMTKAEASKAIEAYSSKGGGI